MRLGYLSDFSPKKLGTGENRIVAFALAARSRGHRFTLIGRQPIHPEVHDGLSRAGAAWQALDDLERRPLRAARTLSREFDVLQMNMIPPRGRAAIAAYLAWPARVLFVDRVSGAPGERSDRRPVPHRLLDRVTMLRVHQLAGITEYVRSRAQRRFGMGTERTLTIYNGVDTSRFCPSQAPRSTGVPVRILTVANLIPEKGIDVLLRAVAGLGRHPWRLTVVGEGPQAGRLRKMAAELGMEAQTDFLGLRDDVPDLMRAADVFVHPAVWNEALGNTVLEGMASGCCVIASRAGGIPELAQDGREALLAPPGDVEALTKAIGRAAADPALRVRLGAAARARVLRDFSLEQSIARHLDWCELAAQGQLMC